MLANVPLLIPRRYRSRSAPPCLPPLHFSGTLSPDITTFLRAAEAQMIPYPFYFSYVSLQIHFLRRACHGRALLWVDNYLASTVTSKSLRYPQPGESIMDWIAANDCAWEEFRTEMLAAFFEGPEASLRRLEQTGDDVETYARRWREAAAQCGVDTNTHFNCRWFIWGLTGAIRARISDADWGTASLEHAVNIALLAEQGLEPAHFTIHWVDPFGASPIAPVRPDRSPRRPRSESSPTLPSPTIVEPTTPTLTETEEGKGGRRRRRASDFSYRARRSIDRALRSPLLWGRPGRELEYAVDEGDLGEVEGLLGVDEGAQQRAQAGGTKSGKHLPLRRSISHRSAV